MRFVTSPSLRVPRPPTSFAASAGHKIRSTPYLRHVIFLFRASLQTLGHPENAKGMMGETPEVQGPATLHS